MKSELGQKKNKASFYQLIKSTLFLLNDCLQSTFIEDWFDMV